MALNERSASPSANGGKIVLENVVKRYDAGGGALRALDGVSLAVRDGEFRCVVGPSGCGKTTLLRAVAGLETPDSGTVLVDGEPVTGPGPDRGLVFQEYALFPWRTVRGNVRFGLERPACDCSDCEARVRELLELVGLEEFADAYPKELSGGMKQRVGIARALAVDPEILLLDEPFGNVDARTRARLHDEVLDIWARTDQTIVFVTHDIDEAVTLADRIAVMDGPPGVVRSTIDVELSRPRDRTDREFLEYAARIRDELDDSSDAADSSAP